MRGSVSRLAWVALCGVLILSAGCSTPRNEPAPTPPAVQATTDLSTPENAVLAYLKAVSSAYATGNSEVASATMTPEEGVRVDAYIQFNAQQERAIEQRLLAFTVGDVSEDATGAVVTATEEWAYRYFVPKTGDYSSDELSASYDTTYTLTLIDRGWIVSAVEASPHGDVE